mmetsp:Transcript_95974/g.190219  ORF Transcript_95974/g.190219 Transcript_95974/m.190219 type:complete len:222 (-) Transcript_95974:26-691(-)
MNLTRHPWTVHSPHCYEYLVAAGVGSAAKVIPSSLPARLPGHAGGCHRQALHQPATAMVQRNPPSGTMCTETCSGGDPGGTLSARAVHSSAGSQNASAGMTAVMHGHGAHASRGRGLRTSVQEPQTRCALLRAPQQHIGAHGLAEASATQAGRHSAPQARPSLSVRRHLAASQGKAAERLGSHAPCHVAVQVAALVAEAPFVVLAWGPLKKSFISCEQLWQ